MVCGNKLRIKTVLVAVGIMCGILLVNRTFVPSFTADYLGSHNREYREEHHLLDTAHHAKLTHHPVRVPAQPVISQKPAYNTSTVLPYDKLRLTTVPQVERIRKANFANLFHNVDLETEEQYAVEGGPLNYLAGYENPCWLSRIRVMPPVKNAVLRKGRRPPARTGEEDTHLRCLPGVYQVGAAGSGTTDLYDMLTTHSKQLIGGSIKEPKYWSDNRKVQSLSEYVDLFSRGSRQISSIPTSQSGRVQTLLLDGSTFNFIGDKGWREVPGNEGLNEPIYTLPQTIKALHNKTKILVILRNPVDRLLSQFRSMIGTGIKSSPERFESAVKMIIPRWQQCIAASGLRVCVHDYHSELRTTSLASGVILQHSFYYVWIKEWMDVFGKDQVKILRAEDYYSNRAKYLNEIYRFLGLDLISDALAEKVNGARKTHSHNTKSMLPQTREYLNTFFSPFNDMLAKYLNDDRFLWSEYM